VALCNNKLCPWYLATRRHNIKSERSRASQRKLNTSITSLQVLGHSISPGREADTGVSLSIVTGGRKVALPPNQVTHAVVLASFDPLANVLVFERFLPSARA
jgi:hypothetical protein